MINLWAINCVIFIHSCFLTANLTWGWLKPGHPAKDFYVYYQLFDDSAKKQPGAFFARKCPS